MLRSWYRGHSPESVRALEVAFTLRTGMGQLPTSLLPLCSSLPQQYHSPAKQATSRPATSYCVAFTFHVNSAAHRTIGGVKPFPQSTRHCLSSNCSRSYKNSSVPAKWSSCFSLFHPQRTPGPSWSRRQHSLDPRPHLLYLDSSLLKSSSANCMFSVHRLQH